MGGDKKTLEERFAEACARLSTEGELALVTGEQVLVAGPIRFYFRRPTALRLADEAPEMIGAREVEPGAKSAEQKTEDLAAAMRRNYKMIAVAITRIEGIRLEGIPPWPEQTIDERVTTVDALASALPDVMEMLIRRISRDILVTQADVVG